MAADPHTDDISTQRFARATSASQRLREVTFPLVMRGYHRNSVDDFLAELLSLVDDLEANQTREGVVQKALGELGEETAGILQRAHETADEITSRSRAQADTRLQRAEREAEILRRDADEYAEQVISDTRTLWEERQRLIEDIRQLADEVLGTADDAMERLKLPEAIESAEAEAAAAPTVSQPLEPPEPAAGDLDPSEPYRLGAVEQAPLEQAPLEEPPPFEEPSYQEPPFEESSFDEDPQEESGHTVELEALPGGSEEPPERERD
jgi:DivIVA domain-containing protein